MSRIVSVLVLALLLPAAAWSVPLTFQASLDGPSEFPANSSPATGSSSVTYDASAHTLQVSVSFSGLLGATTASHIHCCVSPNAATPTAGVATTLPTLPNFPLGVTSGSYLQTLDLTQATSWNPAFVTANGGTPAGAEAALAAGLQAGFAYLNIHSTVVPGGEIRGFLVPEPSLLVLLAAGLVALRRRDPA